MSRWPPPAEELERLGREWKARELDAVTDPEWLEKRKGPRRLVSSGGRFARRLDEGAEAVHAALSAVTPAGRPAEAGAPPALSEKNVLEVERAAAAGAKRADRPGRARYLYWLLCRLEAGRQLTFTLPAQRRERPPRALAFDALNPDLPSVTRFSVWQRHVASRALDARPLKKRGAASQFEREYLAVAALFAFGGPCGRTALSDVARLEAGDLDPARGTLWLRDPAGNRTLELTLHPVQALATALYRRDAGESHDTDPLFPSVTTAGGGRSFRRWLAAELGSADSLMTPAVSGHEARPRLRSLLAGAHRWMLELYPAYLASVLAGRFHSAAAYGRDGAPVARRRPLRGGAPAPGLVPAGAEERRLRAAMREELKAHAAGFNGHVMSWIHDAWGRILHRAGAATAPPPAASPSPEGRAWNLRLLCEAVRVVYLGGQIGSRNSLGRWFNTGCAVLDELGGVPAWALGDRGRAALALNFSPRAAYDVEVILRHMAGAAARWRLPAYPGPDWFSAGRGASGPRAVPSPKRVNTRPRPVEVPSRRQIERMAALLRAEADAREPKAGGVSPRELLLYLDLLALGLRKREALGAAAVDFDRGGGGDDAEADLVVAGTKTAAAFRLVPLDRHPHGGSAARVEAAARAAGLLDYDRGQLRWPKPLLSREENPRRPRPSQAGLDKALSGLGSRVGLRHLTPHALRHAAVSHWLEEGEEPELIAKFVGHVDLPTTFQHYMHSLARIQARDLGRFLVREENRVWVAAADARAVLGVSKQAVGKRYRKGMRLIRGCEHPGLVLRRSGRCYVDAAAVAEHLRGRLAMNAGPRRGH